MFFALIDPVTLTFDLWLQTITLVGYPKVIPYTKFEDFGIIRFSSKAADRHRDTQTDADDRFTPATDIGVSNNNNHTCKVRNVSNQTESEASVVASFSF